MDSKIVRLDRGKKTRTAHGTVYRDVRTRDEVMCDTAMMSLFSLREDRVARVVDHASAPRAHQCREDVQ